MDAKELRPEVLTFACEMERQLRANDHKGGWQQCAPDWLFGRMREEENELLAAMVRVELDPWHATAGRTTVERVVHEAADVANFAMMIADVCGGLAAPAPAKEPPPLVACESCVRFLTHSGTCAGTIAEGCRDYYQHRGRPATEKGDRT